MNKFFSFLKPVSASGNIQSSTFNFVQWRGQFILTILRITSVLGFALLLFSYSTTTPNDRILFIGMYLFLIAITAAPVSYNLRAYSLLLIIFAIGANAILAWGPWADGSLFLLVSIVLASLLFDRRIDIFLLSIGVFLMAGIAVLHQAGIFLLTSTSAPVTDAASWLIYWIDFTVAGLLIVMATGRFRVANLDSAQKTQAALSQLTKERAQLEAVSLEYKDALDARVAYTRTSASIAKIVMEIQNITDLLESITRLISEKFGYYHVGLLIIDEQKKTAFLQSASSAAGKALIGQGLQLEPAKQSGINKVVQQNVAVISSDREPQNFIQDANFPLTRSRMLLPLAVRGNIFGLLDMHSDQPQTFGTQDAESLQSLADVVAISFDNLRLLNESKNLVAQSEINASIQTQRIWTQLTSRNKPAYQYTPAGVRPVFSKDKQDKEIGLQVPLTLHGQSIGVIKLKRKGAITTWSEQERVLIEKVADQIALALENSRLVDEAQKSALRDQMIANISARIRGTLDVESVIRTAATELRRVFDLKETEISIGALQEAIPPIRKVTSSLRLRK